MPDRRNEWEELYAQFRSTLDTTQSQDDIIMDLHSFTSEEDPEAEDPFFEFCCIKLEDEGILT